MAVKTDYKVGDKVVFISENEHKEFPSYYPEVGTVGTVLGRDANTCAFVKWEKGSTSSDDHWACRFDWIIHAKEYFKKEKEKGNVKKNGRKFELISGNKIVITADGATTTARFYDGKKVIKAAKAECSPEDEFDFKIGAKIAFDRLVDNEIKNPRKYYNGKVIFSENTGDFKEGVLYVFRSNGDVEDFFGNPVFSGGQKVTHTYNSFSDIDGFYGNIVAEVK